jgi:hypothetical protein
MKPGNYIIVSGCGSTNSCKNCIATSCSPFVKDGTILGVVTDIIRLNDFDGSMDKIYFDPAHSLVHYDTMYTRRKWCTLVKNKPEEIVEILF